MKLLSRLLRRLSWLTILGPGLLVAATGVGAGDLATAAFAGSKLGLVVLWAVLLGAGFKYVLNEGLTRWQLATGTTILEGVMRHLGRPAQILFLLYLLPWSFVVGSALMSACGAAAHALLPITGQAHMDKIIWGIVHSAAGVFLVRVGGFKLFEKIMAACIAVMFVTVLTTTWMLAPDWGAVTRGLLLPDLSVLSQGGLAWTVALIGGVGGTLTILCYGYWIREAGRSGPKYLNDCRIDLAAGYVMTALFGVCMVIIGSTVNLDGKGAGLIVALADRLQEPLGAFGRYIFIFGAWAAIFSSLFGVWQSVPYIFADFWSLCAGDNASIRQRRVAASSSVYQGYLYALATVPALGLFMNFREMQKLYAIVGAAFLPLLALALLILNGRQKWVGSAYRNNLVTSVALVSIIVFFFYAGWLKLFA